MLIGITGKKRSGKDTFAGYMADEFAKNGLDPVLYKFAEPLKLAIGMGMVAIKSDVSFQDLDGGTNFDREREFLTAAEVSTAMAIANRQLDIDIKRVDVYKQIIKSKVNQYYERGELAPKHLLFSIRDVLQMYGTDIVRNMWQNDFWLMKAGNMYEHVTKNDKNRPMIITDCRFDNEINLIKQFGGVLFNVVREDATITNVDNHASENGITDYSDAIEIKNDGALSDLQAKAILHVTDLKK